MCIQNTTTLKTISKIILNQKQSKHFERENYINNPLSRTKQAFPMPPGNVHGVPTFRRWPQHRETLLQLCLQEILICKWYGAVCRTGMGVAPPFCQGLATGGRGPVCGSIGRGPVSRSISSGPIYRYFVMYFIIDIYILCLTSRMTVTSARISEEDACYCACNLCVFSHVQKRTTWLMHKGCVLQRISLGVLNDITIVLGMRQV